MTVISSAINTLYFTTYKTRLKGRRIGAAALATISGATLIEALYHGAGLAIYGPDVSLAAISPGLSIAVRALMAGGSIFISLLALRQRWAGRSKSRRS